MKQASFLTIAFVMIAVGLSAQKIVPIEYKGNKYEALHLTTKGRVMWGNNEEIALNAAKSESSGANNTAAIVLAVGKNEGHDGKMYAARLCSEATNGGKEDWYLPSKDEADGIYAFKSKFNVEERGTIWTSTESSGTQAYTLYWYTGASYKNMKVEDHDVVCIRKVEETR